MYLKRLELQGFKSFPDKIKLEFNKVITAVVGPNGSGKSNISDAVRWVLGEQSVKSLRGAKMEDVIFLGTSNRRALGFAEVSLVIDNESGMFPIDYSEVTVTRRVYRSGEGEYEINGTSCRLKDIHELFMDTGIGREGYSIISQGRIDEILSARSEDRRHLFEEAAGIVKYKNRRQETYSKLEKEKQNLVRVNDIIEELQTQIEPLRKQSEKAKEYISLAERLKLLHISIFLNEVDNYENDMYEMRKNADILQTQIQDEIDAIESCKEDMASEKEVLTRIESETKNTTDGINAIILETEKCKNDIKLMGQHTDHLTAGINRVLKESESKLIQIGAAQEATELSKSKVVSLQIKLQTVKSRLEKQQAEFDRLNLDLLSNEQLIEKHNTEIIDNMKILSQISNDLSRTGFTLEQALKRKDGLLDDKVFNLSKMNEGEAELQVLIKRQRELNGISERLVNEHKLETELRKNIQNDLSEAKSKEAEAVKILNEKSARRKTLWELKEGYEGYNKSVKSVLKSSFNGICGVVGELISVPRQYETAIEVALGGTVQNIVTTDESAAKEAIEYLKRTNSGRATFLPISAIKANDFGGIQETVTIEQGVIGLAADLVRYDSIYSGIIDRLLGKVIVMDTMDNAISLSKKHGYRYKIVTLQGELISVGGALTGGSMAVQATNIFTRGREISQLNQEIKDIEKACNSLRESIVFKETMLEKNDVKLSSLNEDIQDIRLELSGYTNKAAQLKESLALLTSKKESFEAESFRINEQIETAQREMEQHGIRKNQAEAAIENIKHQMDKYQSSIQESKELKENRIDQLTSLRIEKSEIEQSIRVEQENHERIQREIKSFNDGINQMENEVKESRLKISENEKQIESKRSYIEVLDAKLMMKQEYLLSLASAKERSNKQLLELEKKVQEHTELLQRLRDSLLRLEMKIEAIEGENRRRYEYMWEEYELTYQMAKQYPRISGSTSGMQREERDIKSKIRELGTVNVGAVEEYKVVTERYEFLTRQRDDIVAAEEKLNEIIQQLTSLMEIQFLEQFKIISENFNIVFSEIFGGGSAKLVLSDNANVLDSGIEIIAEPPGKALKNMMLLSGGERALTAISLLFAILRIKPSPFCILDEIESALDDANVMRYANYLKKLSGDTQFILITHRKATMETADVIYGVTMQEQGVSKLVSVDFNNENEVAV